jgi:hypothetical protein
MQMYFLKFLDAYLDRNEISCIIFATGACLPIYVWTLIVARQASSSTAKKFDSTKFDIEVRHGRLLKGHLRPS